jgi:hypothetical protein
MRQIEFKNPEPNLTVPENLLTINNFSLFSLKPRQYNKMAVLKWVGLRNLQR